MLTIEKKCEYAAVISAGVFLVCIAIVWISLFLFKRRKDDWEENNADLRTIRT
ncbi:MAG: hypothetical protein LBJ20_00670 [Candidatus Methanoplasma sp.]|nr:hypothetical protein [Candidatus Methanoplasma sp.]